MRYYQKNNIQFAAPLNANNILKYNSLRIGTPEAPYFKNTPKFVFSIKNKIIQSTDIDITEFKKLSGLHNYSEYIGDEWPAGTMHYNYSGYGMLIHKNKIMQFYAVKLHDLSKYSPRIGLTQDTLYPLPLSERNVVKIFGKEDNFHDFFMH